MYNVLMTFVARIFRDAQTPALDLDWFVKLPCGKRERMKKAVLCFGEILWDKSRRRMTVVAGGD
jgi:hypothetical protein